MSFDKEDIVKNPWIGKGLEAKARILAHPELGINSPEYHEYMNYAWKVAQRMNKELANESDHATTAR